MGPDPNSIPLWGWAIAEINRGPEINVSRGDQIVDQDMLAHHVGWLTLT
jgi:hypothetical protein